MKAEDELLAKSASRLSTLLNMKAPEIIIFREIGILSRRCCQWIEANEDELLSHREHG
jgi:hypothetical protein